MYKTMTRHSAWGYDDGRVLTARAGSTGDAANSNTSTTWTGDGNGNKRSSITPGKRKNDRDDDDNGDDTPKSIQTWRLSPST
jgi:hypothetical protein